jgi:hypothetical protein
MVDENGWVGWNMIGEKIGHNPFDRFTPGGWDDQLSCRFGAGPEVATDNVLDLAWAPIADESAGSAMAQLSDDGWERISVEQGEIFAQPDDGSGWADEEGYGAAYLFTSSDVRWAQLREYLDFIRPPADQ